MQIQASFSDLEYAAKKKQTRRDRFLAEIDAVTPWRELVAVCEPHHPAASGRPPIGVERMLRMHVAQQCLGLSDEGIEDAIYDSQAICRFVGIDLAREAAPDATTVLKFRRFLEQHDLTAKIFATINAHLAKRGLILRQGTIVDATIIAAPSSTKNRDGQRDPDMHQTRKGKQWYFHTVVANPANVADVTQAHVQLHGQETDVFGDAGCQGVGKRDEVQQRHPNVNWHVAMRPGKRRALPATPWGEPMDRAEQTKARIRAKAEHAFHVVKNLLGHKKTRYRGLEKNRKQLFTLFGLANLVLARTWLWVPDGGIAPVAP